MIANTPSKMSPYDLDSIRVADAMHYGVIRCSPETPLSSVAKLMAEHRVHCVVVAEELGNHVSLWGVIADLDLIAAVSVRALKGQLAGGSATSFATTVDPNETLQRAAELMTEQASTHLVVTDPTSGQPLGVLSTLDIATALASLVGGADRW